MKRLLCMLISVALLLTATAVAPITAVSVVYGDLNGDGEINNRDLVAMQQYLNGWDVTVDVAAADANGDGEINNRDLVLLQQYLNNWDVKLGPDKPVVPPAELPAVGYDLDPEHPDRIVVESISQDGYEVTVTIANICTQWITEETSCVKYICTDADGNVLTLEDKFFGEFYFGMLEVGKSFTGTITLPEGTVKLEFGTLYTRYWTPWH